MAKAAPVPSPGATASATTSATTETPAAPAVTTVTPAATVTATPASSTPSAPAATSVATTTAGSLAAIKVLLIPIDDVGGREGLEPANAPATTSTPAADGTTNQEELPTLSPSLSRVIGPAEAISGPLRRALMKRGVAEVLAAGPESTSMRRALGDGRIATQTLDDLKRALPLLVPTSAAATAPAAPSVPASTATPSTDDSASAGSTAAPVPADVGAPSNSNSSGIVTNVTRSASVSEASGARQLAIQAAANIGQSLGYRAVIAYRVSPSNTDGSKALSMLIVDAVRENGEAVLVPVAWGSTTNTRAFYEAAADSSSTLLQGRLQAWGGSVAVDKNRLVDAGLQRAKSLLSSGDATGARDELNRVLSIDPTRSEAYSLLSDALLQAGDARSAVVILRRTLDTTPEADKGAGWARLAAAYVSGSDWPAALDAGSQALLAKFDSVPLRVAMAQAQMGRARLFEDAGRSDSAAFALEDAEAHVQKARELAPDDTQVLRLQAQLLMVQNKTSEALKLFDRIASKSPDDAEMQASYARLLLSRTGRAADAFAAWTVAWTLLSKNGTSTTNPTLMKLLPAPDRLRFRRLSDGFDLTSADAAKTAYMLTNKVVNGTLSREEALVQIRVPVNTVAQGYEVLKWLQPAEDRQRTQHLARIEAADSLNQAMAAYNLFLETGDDSYRDRAMELHKEAIAKLNALRSP